MLFFCYKKLDTPPILRIVACNKKRVTTYIIKGPTSLTRRLLKKKLQNSFEFAYFTAIERLEEMHYHGSRKSSVNAYLSPSKFAP